MPKLHVRMFPLISIVFGFIVIGTFFYALLENWTYLDALYFTVTTLTTVGYGDLYPTTSVTKLFTIGYVIIGVYMLVHAFHILTTYYFEKKAPSIKKAVTQSLEHMALKKKQKGEVILKVKTVDKPA